jgi:hypothetical protein
VGAFKRIADPFAAPSRRFVAFWRDALRLEGIQIGDIVEVDRLGRCFHALVMGNASDGLSIQPLDRRISYRSCRADDVLAKGDPAPAGLRLLARRRPSRRGRTCCLSHGGESHG